MSLINGEQSFTAGGPALSQHMRTTRLARACISRFSDQPVSAKDLYSAAQTIQIYQIPQSTEDRPVEMAVQGVMNHVGVRIWIENDSVGYVRRFRNTPKLLENKCIQGTVRQEKLFQRPWLPGIWRRISCSWNELGSGRKALPLEIHWRKFLLAGEKPM